MNPGGPGPPPPPPSSEVRRRLICSRSNSMLSSGSRASFDSSFTTSSISSPVTDLTFDLQVLSTHGKRSAKFARRKLSLNLSTFSASPDVNSPSFLKRCASVDDGCCVDSPGSSGSRDSVTYDSPFLDNLLSSSIESKHRLKEGFKRYSSVPNATPAAFGLTSVKEMLSSHSAENISRSLGDENKENEVERRELESRKTVSFKLPTSPAPRGIVSPFKDDSKHSTSGKQSSIQGNCMNKDLLYKSPKTPAKAYSRTLSRRLSNDDGFLQLEMEEELVERIHAVPKGLEGLFFSPVIEGNESEASPIPQKHALSTTAQRNEEAAPPAARLFHSPSEPKLIHRKYSAQGIRVSYKRSESHSQDSDLTPLQLKRWKGLTKEKEAKTREDGVAEKQAAPRRIMRCHSETEIFIKTALSWADSQQNLIGDFSKLFCLPLVNGKHQDLKAISPETMAAIVNNDYNDIIEQCIIVDCRYPYEFNGGHIKGARNVYTTEDLVDVFFTSRAAIASSKLTLDGNSSDSMDSSSWSASDVPERRTILVFHCEFSSERGPKLSRFLRNHDRDSNVDSYPVLSYPEIYLLEGGYKAFYESFPHLCQPQDYVPMLQQDHLAELKIYRSKANSWGIAEKSRVVGRNTAAHPSLNL